MAAESNAVPDVIRVRIEADLSTGGPYDVLIGHGLLRHAGEPIAAAVPAHRFAIITDDNAGPLHAGTIADAVRTGGRPVDVLSFAAGERSKTRETWSRLTDALIESGHGRDSCIIAAGGGVVGDVAGFVAATYMRGIPFVNVPTTLLAMVDSAVGGKTGVDTPMGKNLVGAFHQPSIVLIDPAVLSTLAEPDYRASLSEAIKHGVILDAEYFGWMADNVAAIAAREERALTHLVRRSVELKAGVVGRDTREAGVRAILNFGHTLGHAIERVTDYRVAHGVAVAIGMVLEARLGESLGITGPGTADRIAALLGTFGLPTDPAGVGVASASLLAAARTDKKSRDSAVRYALPERIGRMHEGAGAGWTVAVPEEAVRRVTQGRHSAISQAGTEF